MNSQWRGSLGAVLLEDESVRFRVWAPHASTVELQLSAPVNRTIALSKGPEGYHEAVIDGVQPGARYTYSIDGGPGRPDPASRYQPEGVHGPSAVIDPSAFVWSQDRWFAPTLDDYVIYELHVGTFTAAGTFEAVIPHLDHLKSVGITAIELLPVAQFPGERNWGYDGVTLFAVQNSYGGPDGLRRLVDACHQRGLAVVLDVVYNHLGPEGNYLGEYGPYFTDKYKTPWGMAINYDDTLSDEVRHFFIENALHWLHEYRVDAFRLDAVHAILDHGAYHFLAELRDEIHRHAEHSSRHVYVIAESDMNDPRVIHPRSAGGYDHDGQWSDDLHHALHALLTGERSGYYEDFGSVSDLARAYQMGYVFTGQHSGHRGRRHGAPARLAEPRQFIICSQNHDQVGNRAEGDRLTGLVDFERLKLAACATILSPFTPLIFMGEEYGEPAPFQYFTSHTDADLVEAVRKGRREEFSAFRWQGEVPDPQDPSTFKRSKLDHSLKTDGHHRTLEELYQELIQFRRSLPALASPSFDRQEVIAFEVHHIICLRRWHHNSEAYIIMHFAEQESTVTLPLPAGNWAVALDTAGTRWGGASDRLASTIESNSEATMSIGPASAVLLIRDGGTR